MPQGRIVLKQICQSRKLTNLKTDGARLLYTWLIPNVDANGCFSGDPEVIKGQIFTRLKKSAKTIQIYLDDLSNQGLVILYEANGDKFLCIPDFVDKQPSLNPNKEAKTTIPMPTPDQLQSNSRVTPPKVKVSKVKVNKEYSPNSVEFRLSLFLLSLIRERKPDFKHPDLQKWCVHINRMIHRDNRAIENIEAVIRWSQDDDFWQNNILSTEKLRKQFDKLELKMNRKGKPNGSSDNRRNSYAEQKSQYGQTVE